MRRSQRLQLQRQKATHRLAAVPEIENEEEEVMEVSVYGRSVNRITPEGHMRCDSPVPPPFPDVPGAYLMSDAQSMQPSATLARICSNLRGTPLHFWRRQAWINSSRRSLPLPPAPPPPPSQKMADRQRLHAPSSSLGPAIQEEETEEQAEDKEAKDEAAQGQEVIAQKEGKEELGKTTGPTLQEDSPLNAECSTPVTVPTQHQGFDRPPPSYNVAVAEKEQLAALKAATAKCSENTAETTTVNVQEQTVSKPESGIVTATKSNGNLEHSTPVKGQRTFWMDYSLNANEFPNQVDASRLIQLKQQVEITCCTLYGRGENPNGNSIQEDLETRHSLLVQILNAGRQRDLEREVAAGAEATGKSVDVSPEEEHVKNDLIKE